MQFNLYDGISGVTVFGITNCHRNITDMNINNS